MPNQRLSSEDVSRATFNKINSETAGNLSMEDVIRRSYDPVNKRLYAIFTGTKNSVRVKI